LLLLFCRCSVVAVVSESPNPLIPEIPLLPVVS
jgi:hypothetical protein